MKSQESPVVGGAGANVTAGVATTADHIYTCLHASSAASPSWDAQRNFSFSPETRSHSFPPLSLVCVCGFQSCKDFLSLPNFSNIPVLHRLKNVSELILSETS